MTCKRVGLVFILLAACSTKPSPVEQRDIFGLYSGVGLGDPAPVPIRIQLRLGEDHAFIGNVLSGPGGYPVQTGRWRTAAVVAVSYCRQIDLLIKGRDPFPICIASMPDGSTCLNYFTYGPDNGCAMTKKPEGHQGHERPLLASALPIANAESWWKADRPLLGRQLALADAA